MEKDRKRRVDSKLVVGLILIVIGIFILTDRTHFVSYSIFDILAIIAVVGGSIHIIEARNRKDYREGAWWIFLGVWFYISYHKITGYGFGDTWPLLIIALGIGHIWKASDVPNNYTTIKE
jgi:uncharacterized membrane protein HdeD (DUF308 family)